MITYRRWMAEKKGKRRWVTSSYRERKTYQIEREGWFLLGLLPLYVRDLDTRPV